MRQLNRMFQELRRSKESFYSYAIKIVLKNHGGTIKNAKLRLDGHGDRNFKNAFRSYLRRELNPTSGKTARIFQDLKFVDSKKNVLIQLADMISGSIHRRYNEEKSDRLTYYNIIRHKIEDIWNFGR